MKATALALAAVLVAAPGALVCTLEKEGKKDEFSFRRAAR